MYIRILPATTFQTCQASQPTKERGCRRVVWLRPPPTLGGSSKIESRTALIRREREKWSRSARFIGEQRGKKQENQLFMCLVDILFSLFSRGKRYLHNYYVRMSCAVTCGPLHFMTFPPEHNCQACNWAASRKKTPASQNNATSTPHKAEPKCNAHSHTQHTGENIFVNPFEKGSPGFDCIYLSGCNPDSFLKKKQTPSFLWDPSLKTIKAFFL